MRKFFLLTIVVSFTLLLIANAHPIYAAVPVGNYLVLNGGYVHGINEDSSSPSGFTFEAWIRPDSLSGMPKIISIGDNDIPILRYEVGMKGGLLSFTYNNGLGGSTTISSGQLTADIWQHVAVTISAQETKLFINGKLVFAPQISHGALAPIGRDIILGNSYLNTFFQNYYPFKGDIDEVRISKVARDVVGLWNSGAYNSSLSADGDTVLLWRMDEVRGEVIAQDSGAGDIDGYLIGGDQFLGDLRIHFYGVLPSPTPTPTITWGLQPIQWTRPALPTLSFPSRTNLLPISVPAPEENNPSPTPFFSRDSSRPPHFFR